MQMEQTRNVHIHWICRFIDMLYILEQTQKYIVGYVLDSINLQRYLAYSNRNVTHMLHEHYGITTSIPKLTLHTA